MIIKLFANDNTLFKQMNVPAEKVTDLVKASVLTVNDRWFMFQSTSGRFFGEANFQEIDPPVGLEFPE